MTKKTLDFAPLHGVGRSGISWLERSSGLQADKRQAESAGAGSQGLTVLPGFLPDFKPSPIPNQWESLSDSTSQTVFFSFHFTVRGGM